jgi:RNA polymerase sigma-70 factor (ECF subfamily)
MDAASESSPTLLSRVRDPADAAAWKEFDERYGELIVRYGRGRGLQHADAEDNRQVVMAKLSRSLGAFQYSPERGRFRSYLGRVVQNEVIRLVQRQSLPVSRVDPDDGMAAAGDGCGSAPHALEVLWEREWRHHHLRLATRHVREAFEPRSVAMFERLLAGAAVSASAEEFQTTPQAVHKVKQRIRDRMQAILARQIRDEESPIG